MINFTLFGVHWIDLFYEEKKDIFKMTFMSEARNGIWLYDNERENTAEKNDFMTISNYLSTVLINLLHTHTHSLWWLNCFKE